MTVKIRNKITEKEAVQFIGNYSEIERFVGEKFNYNNGDFNVVTLEGYKPVKEGYWIIKGLKGEFYPCDPDIFEKSYEIIS